MRARLRSIQEKDDKIKTVEELLEMGMIEVANKEEDLKVRHRLDQLGCT